jgi:hypothetical protein
VQTGPLGAKNALMTRWTWLTKASIQRPSVSNAAPVQSYPRVQLIKYCTPLLQINKRVLASFSGAQWARKSLSSIFSTRQHTLQQRAGPWIGEESKVTRLFLPIFTGQYCSNRT